MPPETHHWIEANVQSHPCSSVCRIEMYWDKPKKTHNFATGFLIGRKTVVTAAHVLTLEPENYFPERVIVGPGATTGVISYPYGMYTATRDNNAFYVPDYYKKTHGDKFDYGVIKLSTEVNGAGHFGLYAEKDDETLRQMYTYTSGYAEKITGLEGRQILAADKLLQALPEVLLLRMTLKGGDSGSPVWIFDDEAAYAIGIVSGYAGKNEIRRNKAVRITDEIFRNIKSVGGQDIPSY